MLDALKIILRPHLGHLALLIAVALSIVGLAAIDTAPTASYHGPVVLKQAIFLMLAVTASLVIALPHHRHVCNIAYPLALVTLPLLVLLLIPGVPEFLVPLNKGARRWIDLQFLLFQPSEMAKVVFVLALAHYLRYRENYRTLLGLAVPMVLTFIPMTLILLEPDLGTAMVFLPVLFAMLLAAGAKLKHLLMVGLLGLALIAGGLVIEFAIWPPIARHIYPDQPNKGLLLRPHQRDRLVAMVSQVQGEAEHRDDIGFQGYKAMTTAGAGQAAGYGKERANYILDMNGLPEAHNDMIFAVICARWGFFGGAAVIGLYMLLFAVALLISALNRDPFARLMVVGLVTIMFTQVFVNVGMTIGLLPITGLTLPLISYGGSSLLITYLMIGLIVNVAARRPTLLIARSSFEFGGGAEMGRA